jgi:hypothetical protein
VRAWYCPSWNGDWRLEEDGKGTKLSIVRPTSAELKQLASLAEPLDAKGWISQEDKARLLSGKLTRFGRGTVEVHAPVADVGPVVTSIVQPGPAVLTAVRFKDGTIEVAQTSNLAKPTKEGYRDNAKPTEPTEEATALAKREDADKAATVKRPTPCCPDCYVDAVGPATEVLLSFLDDEQHASWRDHRFVIVRGGTTGHRYLIAHRNTPLATRNKRMTYDLEDQQVMHFHDWTVPPEEEVLAVMLILRHREAWLRNEATALGTHRHKFKNPFGDGMDGVQDSSFTYGFGAGLLGHA